MIRRNKKDRKDKRSRRQKKADEIIAEKGANEIIAMLKAKGATPKQIEQVGLHIRDVFTYLRDKGMQKRYDKGTIEERRDIIEYGIDHVLNRVKGEG